MKTKRILGKLWNSSPSDVAYLLRRRIKRLITPGEWDYDYSWDSIVNNPKLRNVRNSRLHIENWERLWRVINAKGHGSLRKLFGFQHKTVMEVGCGPLLGWGPLALFLGADFFFFYEPGLVPQVVASIGARDSYFVPMYEELVANYGEAMSFAEWYGRIKDNARGVDLDGNNLADLILSNSVLEHIARSEMKSLLQSLWNLTKPGGLHFHAVDFGPHGIRLSLQELYQEARERVGSTQINCLRKSDLEKAFKNQAFVLSDVVVYKMDTIRTEQLHDSWRACSDLDLASRLVVFICTKSSTPGEAASPQLMEA